MKEQLAKIRSEALARLWAGPVRRRVGRLRVQYLGKKGELTAVLKMMGKLSAEERRHGPAGQRGPGRSGRGH